MSCVQGKQQARIVRIDSPDTGVKQPSHRGSVVYNPRADFESCSFDLLNFDGGGPLMMQNKSLESMLPGNVNILIDIGVFASVPEHGNVRSQSLHFGHVVKVAIVKADPLLGLHLFDERHSICDAIHLGLDRDPGAALLSDQRQHIFQWRTLCVSVGGGALLIIPVLQSVFAPAAISTLTTS